MRRRHERIGDFEIVGVQQIVGDIENQPCVQNEEHRSREQVLDGRVGSESDRVAFDVLHLHAVGIVLPGDVQRPDMEDDECGDDEGQEVVQRVEPVERWAADREPAPEPVGDRRSDEGNRGEEIGDDRRAGEAHRTPGQHIAHERGRHHQEIDDDADDPKQLARRLERAVVEAAQHVDVAGEEEQRRAARVHVTDQPAVVHVPHDVVDRGESLRRRRHVMHRENDAGDDLRDQHEGQDRAERPHVVEISRRRIDHERRMNQAHQGQTRFKPAPERALGNIGRGSAHGFGSLKGVGPGKGRFREVERMRVSRFLPWCQ